MTFEQTDTIVAQASAAGKGGVGIVRVSGPGATTVATKVLGQCPPPRTATYLPFRDEHGEAIDQGIALFFQGPHSFTGEDVLELQGHGGQVVIDMLLSEILRIDNIRVAKPGEFSERAFLNDKLDLAQAEAIADLIDASSQQAARSAMRSLQGEFSQQIHAVVEQVIQLRMYVEAAIDFPEEEIDFLSDGKVAGDLASIVSTLSEIRHRAQQGSLLREGMQVVIAGKPNAGKSSLLNALAGRDAAIVTDVAGTTRDVLKEHIHIDGMPLHIIDTAGLRDSDDKVEQIGIERAWNEIRNADQVLIVVDAAETPELDPYQTWPDFMHQLPDEVGVTLVRNKQDLVTEDHCIEVISTQRGEIPIFRIAASQRVGIEALAEHLKQCMGYASQTDGQFIARRRHLTALNAANEHILSGQTQLLEHAAGEILAEDLRIAQNHLNEITGEFSSDDLLGRIFSSFCIGK
ncbi:tRNA uridine-5-carboxymethylaminomethyl(34) synthesis GTPase MnmE [Alteromonas oceanisediminis]|uniref:tRNA uridine-5-carboxymethylaminomethyl(34) synthesis GTPase MnmE n=1 Tax=Alteromonas oceanisediminis TaxID=2836180 RepID=UPI001BDA9618|nr:tRNA uridine-5-carboxymethylaminomethyl(34) synthesis GTPase MnmE [Alteromonas oceanisediminis]MBT0586712.1 tRNA uridine-5-carboxymethylaminomethyl(34) synthesis GTPase MnmE [Alteromonas oceanisediminis]